jgi:hypothetical protein
LTVGNAFDSGEIGDRADAFELCPVEHGPTGVGLTAAVLEEQPSTRFQVQGCAMHEHADTVEAIRTPNQGPTRFEAKVTLFKMWITDRDIGRIGHNGVEPLVAEAGVPVAL